MLSQQILPPMDFQPLQSDISYNYYDQQIKFQGDLGDDMPPPITDDEEEDTVQAYNPQVGKPNYRSKFPSDVSGYEGDQDYKSGSTMSKNKQRRRSRMEAKIQKDEIMNMAYH